MAAGLARSRACDGADAVSDVRPAGRADGAAGTFRGVEGCRAAGADSTQCHVDEPVRAANDDTGAPGPGHLPGGDAGWRGLVSSAAGARHRFRIRSRRARYLARRLATGTGSLGRMRGTASAMTTAMARPAACAPAVAPGSEPSLAAEFRCLSCTLRPHPVTSNIFPEFYNTLLTANRAFPAGGAPESCAMHISTRAWLAGKLRLAIIKQLTIYSSNMLRVFNCEYKLRAAPGTGRRSCRPERAISSAGSSSRGRRVRGMSSPGRTLARHLLM